LRERVSRGERGGEPEADSTLRTEPDTGLDLMSHEIKT